jgi:hypothetical protein
VISFNGFLTAGMVGWLFIDSLVTVGHSLLATHCWLLMVGLLDLL